eukprot:jgi/Bigna1/143369/aug1.78_g18077
MSPYTDDNDNIDLWSRGGRNEYVDIPVKLRSQHLAPDWPGSMDHPPLSHLEEGPKSRGDGAREAREGREPLIGPAMSSHGKLCLALGARTGVLQTDKEIDRAFRRTIVLLDNFAAVRQSNFSPTQASSS